MGSDHWSSLVPRLMLQGLLPDAIYEVFEPLPSHFIQSTGSYRIVESDGD
jgi:hypothetical protein